LGGNTGEKEKIEWDKRWKDLVKRLKRKCKKSRRGGDLGRCLSAKKRLPLGLTLTKSDRGAREKDEE